MLLLRKDTKSEHICLLTRVQPDVANWRHGFDVFTNNEY